jgi:phenylpropionate dioxygenase-like ring-hydroxylating dioxygenase large terminal subunit
VSINGTNYQSLPAWTYNNEEFFRLEAELIFRRSWQLVCHLSNIPAPGDFFTYSFIGEHVVVLRGEDGVVRAFHNVCSHRGTRLLDGPSGNVKSRIICPYHAWSYDHKGTLMSVPYEDQFNALNKAEHGLKPLETEIFLGFVFVRIKGDGPGVAAQFAPCLDEIKPYRFEELKPLGRVTMRPRQVNWKNIADNYVDALHIPIAHPELSSLVGTSYGLEVKGDIHKMWGDVMDTRKETASVRAYKKFLPRVDYLPEKYQRHWVYYRLWPNLAFDIYPDQVDFMQFIPVSANETMIREIAFAIPDERREMKAARYLNWRINRQVNREDTQLVKRMQDGMGSTGFTAGPLASNESCLIDSARRMRQTIPIANQTIQPPYKQMQTLIDEARFNG